MRTPLTRRLGVLAPAPVYPEPKPIAPVAVTTAPVIPTTETPAVAPGMLPTTTATPVYTATPPAAAPVEEGGWQGALQRALIGFNKGASRVQLDPTYNPVAAGLVSGAETVGGELESAVNRKLAAQQAAQKPIDEANAAALKTTAEQRAKEPFENEAQQRILDRETEMAKRKAEMGNTPEEIEATARNLVGVPPSMWSQLLGRTSHSRAAIFNRVAELQGKSPQSVQSGYEMGLAGGKAAAAFNAAGKGQQTARAANSVKLLLPGLLKASDEFTRTNLPLANAAISSYDVNTGGAQALALKQYLTDTKLKMSSALMQGGVPTDQAASIINSAFPDGLSAAQMKEAVKNIGDIMDTQIQGGLSPVSLTPGAPAAPATVAPASTPGAFDWRKH